ncbi:DUF5034 domain-containing protein [Pedobacter rhizosphaerae]|uniref:DUF5034 domain-containing protein n=1 Tax=Pedobacter rhizosphaerae TaxID=390241 RepID=A0A1H9S354_9SPHI|nr:DUF5034 domain-containing protein [Pedobacter rhizosphaerae]SER78763.1 protein of unknown function [Pedobacter rhizosphaerae]
MIKKVFLVLGLALMSQLIVACVDCNCPDSQTFYFTNKGLALKNIDTALPAPMFSSAGTINSANYGIQIQMLNEKITAIRKPVKWGLMQAAYACSCEGNYFMSKENISAIRVFSNNDFDSSHPKGTDLSVYFKVKQYKGMTTLADYVKILNDANYIYDEYFFESIYLQTAPVSSKKHKFKIVFALSDGRTLEAETTEIELI